MLKFIREGQPLDFYVFNPMKFKTDGVQYRLDELRSVCLTKYPSSMINQNLDTEEMGKLSQLLYMYYFDRPLLKAKIKNKLGEKSISYKLLKFVYNITK